MFLAGTSCLSIRKRTYLPPSDLVPTYAFVPARPCVRSEWAIRMGLKRARETSGKVLLCTGALAARLSEAARERLGAALRRLRLGAGLSGTRVGTDLGWSQSKVSRMETGRFGASLGEVAALLNYYGVPEEVRAELLSSVARAEGVEGAWVVRAGGPGRRQSEVQDIEARVRHIRQYQALWVPGLLQSPQYAAAVAKSVGMKQVGAFVERRQMRQGIAAESQDLTCEVVVEEDALLRCPGGDSRLQTGQLEHLLAAIGAGWVDLRIRRAVSATTFVAGSFVHYEFRDGSPVVLVEAQAADLYLSAPADVAAYKELFAHLQSEALDREASSALVESMRRNKASQRI